jgi:hypothetical protein
MLQLLGPPLFLPPQGHWGLGQGLTTSQGTQGVMKKSGRELGHFQGPSGVYSEPY